WASWPHLQDIATPGFPGTAGIFIGIDFCILLDILSVPLHRNLVDQTGILFLANIARQTTLELAFTGRQSGCQAVMPFPEVECSHLLRTAVMPSIALRRCLGRSLADRYCSVVHGRVAADPIRQIVGRNTGKGLCLRTTRFVFVYGYSSKQ